MDEEIKEPGFRFQVLNSRVSVAVSDAHSFGTDAFLLADFAAPRFREPACDLGTGCGIIPLIWARDGKPEFCCGVEIQPLGIRQFEASIAASRLENRVLPVLGDLRELPAEMPAGGFGLVTCNPPYKAEHSGILSRSLAEQIARHETLCRIEDVCMAAFRLLRYGGRLCLCQRPERLCDVMIAMRAAGIEPKRLRMVSKKASSPPWLFLLEGKKGGKPFLQVEAPFHVYDENGRYTPEMQRMYGESYQRPDREEKQG